MGASPKSILRKESARHYAAAGQGNARSAQVQPVTSQGGRGRISRQSRCKTSEEGKTSQRASRPGDGDPEGFTQPDLADCFRRLRKEERPRRGKVNRRLLSEQKEGKEVGVVDAADKKNQEKEG